MKVHIRADVLTKTVGNGKKSCGGGTLPRTRQKRIVPDGTKDCLSESDACHGVYNGDDCDHDDKYGEDDVDESCDGGVDNYSGRDYVDERSVGCGVHEQTNRLAAAADRCSKRRRRRREWQPKNSGRRDDSVADQKGSSETMTAAAAMDDSCRPRRDAATHSKTAIKTKAATAPVGRQSELPAAGAVGQSDVVRQSSVHGQGRDAGNGGGQDADANSKKHTSEPAPEQNGSIQNHYDDE